MSEYFLSMQDELIYEKSLYAEVLMKADYPFFLNNAEIFLIHAYSHLLEEPSYGRLELGSYESKTKYNQYYLNLAIGTELLLKAILLKKSIVIHKKRNRTIHFSEIIHEYLKVLLPNLCESTLQEIENSLLLINEKRNNIAHRSKRSYEHYAYEYRFSLVIMYVYEKYFYMNNQLLEELLLKSLDRSKVTSGSDFKSLRVKPKSLRYAQI